MKTDSKFKKTLKIIILVIHVLLICVLGFLHYNRYLKPQPIDTPVNDPVNVDEFKYHFRNDKLLTSHYEKHGIEMGFDSKEAYEKAASSVATNPKALHKNEKEDNDDCYFIEETGEFVVVSTDGYIRTYFIATKKYFDKQ